MNSESGRLEEKNGVKIVHLTGEWHEMGRQYGSLVKPLLHDVLAFLEAKTKGNREKEEKVSKTAEKLFSRYPTHLRAFIDGAAQTSGLTVEQLLLINALEYAEPDFMCSAMAAWGKWTKDGKLIFGRNYDAISYAAVNKDIIVTVFHPMDGMSVAIVGYAGELYAVNGMNESGLFLELNNGMPSGGFDIQYDINASTTELLDVLFRARSMADMDAFFRETQSFSSIIVGVADKAEARSYEWCAAGVKRGDYSTPEGLMIQTNHYVNEEWDFPTPSDEKSWCSLSRRCHLCQQAEAAAGQLDEQRMLEIISTPMEAGGAMNSFTMYQLVAIPEEKSFWIKIVGETDWVKICDIF